MVINQKVPPNGGTLEKRAKRFELSTFSLARRRSTTELHPRLLGRFRPSAERQNRTDDTAIFSRVLYQLSYLGLKGRREVANAA